MSLAAFIGHKAGVQRLIAELEPDNVGIVITQRKEADGELYNHIRICGNGAGDSVTHVIGLLENAKMELWHAEDGDEDGGIAQ